MKRFRKLLLPLFSVLLVLALVFTAACSSCKSKGDNDPETPPEEEQPGDSVTYTLQSISLDTSAAKTDFVIGDAFTSAGLKVTASFSGSDGTSKTEDVSSSAYVNSTAFDGEKQGVYEITVSYSSGLVTASATYVVTVNFEKAGVDVILTEDVLDGITLNATKDEGDFTLDAEHTSVTIDPAQIEVRIPNDKGEVDYTSDPVAATEYTVAVYKTGEAEPLESYNDLGGGVYQIWATLNPEEGDEYEVSNFALVFVSDGITSFAFKDGTQSQDVGADTISATWTFTATYASGDSKTVSKSTLGADETLDIALDTTTAGQNKTANVVYTYKTQRGATKTATTTVTYTINAATTTQTYSYTFIPEGSGSIDHTTGLSDSSGLIKLTAKSESASLAMSSNTAIYNTSSDPVTLTTRIQLKTTDADTLAIAVPGASIITVWAHCGSSWTAGSARPTNHLQLLSSASSVLCSATLGSKAPEGNNVGLDKNALPKSDFLPVHFAVAESGTYYLKADSGSANVGKIEIKSVIPVGETADVKTVTFKSAIDESELAKVKVVNYTGYNTISDLSYVTPEISGYSFNGWYTDKTAGDTFNFSTPVTTDQTVWARFTEQGVTGIKAEKTKTEYVLVNNDVVIDDDDITVTSSDDNALSADWSKTYKLYTDSQMETLYDTDGKLTVSSTALATEATKTFYLKVTASKDDGTSFDASAIAITVRKPIQSDITATKTATSGMLSDSGDYQITVDDIKAFAAGVELDKANAGWTITYSLAKKAGDSVSGEGPWTVNEATDYVITVTVARSGYIDGSLTTTINFTVNAHSATRTISIKAADMTSGTLSNGQIAGTEFYADGDVAVNGNPQRFNFGGALNNNFNKGRAIYFKATQGQRVTITVKYYSSNADRKIGLYKGELDTDNNYLKSVTAINVDSTATTSDSAIKTYTFSEYTVQGAEEILCLGSVSSGCYLTEISVVIAG